MQLILDIDDDFHAKIRKVAENAQCSVEQMFVHIIREWVFEQEDKTIKKEAKIASQTKK